MTVAALAVASQAGAITSAAAKQPKHAPPHIVATPNNVMVNHTVTLVGTHFPANHKLVLRECGAKTWVVTQHECNKAKIHATTNKHGHFRQTFKASICPHSRWSGHPVTERRCYVGEPTPSGVDTINLVGHTRLIVTYP